METASILFSNFALIAVMMCAGWLASVAAKNVTLVDSLWGFGFVLVAWHTFAVSEGDFGRGLLLLVMVTAWGLRLSVHLSVRNWGHGEDPRYRKWRRAAGESFWWKSLFKVFLLQAVFLWVISLGVQVGQIAPRPEHLTVLDAAGFLVWLAGFVFESVGDWQLARFKADPNNRGKVMDRGLWAYTRHPNYFGEMLVWWGIFLVALSVPGGLWTVASPLVITAVLVKMTGIPLTESSIQERRPQYAEYRRRTSAFFPWFPKSKET
jgi:steroid 5-alpha reductase family enzyme